MTQRGTVSVFGRSGVKFLRKTNKTRVPWQDASLHVPGTF